MGIKHFSIFFKNHFGEHIYKLKKNQNLEEINVNIDILMIDMNGIFHNSAQKIFKYGNFKYKRLLSSGIVKNTHNQTEKNVFRSVCETVEHIVNTVKPNKQVILCVDGCAPLSKQNQQRQRRYRSAKESTGDCIFDSNSITPGTKFMDQLSKYIDFFVKQKVNNDWKDLDIVFSNEKVPGEGEHKLINYIRKYSNPNDTFCIHGLDADLIMLSLGTRKEHFYILKDDLYNHSYDFECINIGEVSKDIIKLLRWDNNCNDDFIIFDFIFLCFMVGNDFLPQIPSVEIIEKGIELILEIYKQICSQEGHITYKLNDKKIIFDKKVLQKILVEISKYEKENFEYKMNKKQNFFPDIILENCITYDNVGKINVNIDEYRNKYYEKKLKNTEKEKICHEYFEGMNWVINYYINGVPDWKWFYPYHYAPMCSMLSEHIDTFEIKPYPKSIPSTPFQQLLSVLPPKSAKLIPQPLCNLLLDEKSPLQKNCPDNFELDLSGKRKEWEGIVILPMVDFKLIRSCYLNHIDTVTERDNKRNKEGYSFLYSFQEDEKGTTYKNYHGYISNYKVKTKIIEI